MTREEHLLLCLAEECAEVAQRVSKALRFGLSEVQADQPFNNAERIVEELHDLLSVAAILGREGILDNPTMVMPDTVQRKLAKIEKYFAISREHGTLSSEPHHG